MKIDKDGFIEDFCCEKFDQATKQPNKSISIELSWKDHFLDKPHPRACKWGAPTGRAISSETGITSHSGFEMIPITHCEFCGKEIVFEGV